MAPKGICFAEEKVCCENEFLLQVASEQILNFNLLFKIFLDVLHPICQFSEYDEQEYTEYEKNQHLKKMVSIVGNW